WQAEVRTFGGWPASVSRRAVSALTRLISVQPVTEERGATGVGSPSTQTAESPGGAWWSRTRSATWWSLRPDSCRDVETSAFASDVSATTDMPSRLASTATSIVTALQPLLETASSTSDGL